MHSGTLSSDGKTGKTRRGQSKNLESVEGVEGVEGANNNEPFTRIVSTTTNN